ncbi:hypothetical protein B2J93_7699 [Marssonina coronariae]|uniref:Uncharacterized protein n=1 Tax=Diplocarpon coronariae TaxID=2795749 RepID=A0A218ZI20_9HELO|nr:hypothetical protein B2J93_7699 [Marssonina coronariae]
MGWEYTARERGFGGSYSTRSVSDAPLYHLENAAYWVPATCWARPGIEPGNALGRAPAIRCRGSRAARELASPLSRKEDSSRKCSSSLRSASTCRTRGMGVGPSGTTAGRPGLGMAFHSAVLEHPGRGGAEMGAPSSSSLPLAQLVVVTLTTPRAGLIVISHAHRGRRFSLALAGASAAAAGVWRPSRSDSALRLVRHDPCGASADGDELEGWLRGQLARHLTKQAFTTCARPCRRPVNATRRLVSAEGFGPGQTPRQLPLGPAKRVCGGWVGGGRTGRGHSPRQDSLCCSAVSSLSWAGGPLAAHRSPRGWTTGKSARRAVYAASWSVRMPLERPHCPPSFQPSGEPVHAPLQLLRRPRCGRVDIPQLHAPFLSLVLKA